MTIRCDNDSVLPSLGGELCHSHGEVLTLFEGSGSGGGRDETQNGNHHFDKFTESKFPNSSLIPQNSLKPSQIAQSHFCDK